MYTIHKYSTMTFQADKSYTASAVLDGAELSYFGQEGLSEVVVSQAQPVTFQFQCSAESTNGTGVQGGQIPEIIFYGPSPQKDRFQRSYSTVLVLSKTDSSHHIL